MRRSIHRRWAGDKRKRALGIVHFFSLLGGCFCDRLDGQTMPAKHASCDSRTGALAAIAQRT
jgi:hypothetical protein